MKISIHFNDLGDSAQDEPTASETLDIDLQLGNQAAQHNVEVSVTNTQMPQSKLRFRYTQWDEWWRQTTQYRTADLTGELLIPSVVTNMPDAMLKVDPSRWYGSDIQGVGAIHVTASNITVPQADTGFGVSMSADWFQNESQVLGLIRHAQVMAHTAEEGEGATQLSTKPSDALRLESIYVGWTSPEDVGVVGELVGGDGCCVDDHGRHVDLVSTDCDRF